MTATPLRKAWRLCALFGTVWAVAHSGAALAVLSEDGGEEDPFYKAPWKEAEVSMPAYPKNENLVEFYVAAVASNKFYIDASTLSSDADGVVRYVVVIRTSGGATNVTYEGLRCETSEYKVYGLGRSDGTWARSRSSEWKPVKNELVNRYRAELTMNYFCVVNAPRTAKEAVRVLKGRQTFDASPDKTFN